MIFCYNSLYRLTAPQNRIYNHHFCKLFILTKSPAPQPCGQRSLVGTTWHICNSRPTALWQFQLACFTPSRYLTTVASTLLLFFTCISILCVSQCIIIIYVPISLITRLWTLWQKCLYLLILAFYTPEQSPEYSRCPSKNLWSWPEGHSRLWESYVKVPVWGMWEV